MQLDIKVGDVVIRYVEENVPSKAPRILTTRGQKRVEAITEKLLNKASMIHNNLRETRGGTTNNA